MIWKHKKFCLPFVLDCTTVLIRLLNTLDVGILRFFKLTVETLHDVGKAKVGKQAIWSCLKIHLQGDIILVTLMHSSKASVQAGQISFKPSACFM